MELESLLKYQAIDVELRKLKKEMMQNENIKVAEETKRQFNSCKQTVMQSEAVATKVYGGYEEAVKAYDRSAKRAEELLCKLDDENLSEEECEAIIAELKEINENLNDMAELLVNIKKKGEDAVRGYSGAQKSGRELKNKYTAAVAEVKKLEEEYKPKITKLQKELADARKAVPSELLATYDKLTSENHYPAFVEVYVGDGNAMNCSGCGNALPLNSQSELKSRGFCTCDGCHRVIYYNK